MTIWSVAKLFESIRYTVLRQGFAYYDRFIDNDHSIFMASTEYRFKDGAMGLKAKTHWGIHFPMYVFLNVIYAGTSSFTFDCILYNHATGEELMAGNLTFVYVNFMTRKPAKFPDWYNQCKKSRKFGPPITRLQTPDIPKHAFAFEVRSSYSDLDFNGHVNQSIFVKWCSDAGSEAAICGYLPDFKTEIGKYPESRIRLKYVGEGMVDQYFVIYAWQDENLPLTINFVITRERKIIFVAIFSYSSAYTLAKL